jgi:3-(3-hydroxy-phenyl)propionate hydroxylase
MLDAYGATAPMIAQGLVAPFVRSARRDQQLIAEFDFRLLADISKHPYRVQVEQYKLTHILAGLLAEQPGFGLRFNARVENAEDLGDKVRARPHQRRGAGNALADRRRWRAPRGAPQPGDRVRGLHLAGALPGALHAFEFADVIPNLADVTSAPTRASGSSCCAYPGCGAPCSRWPPRSARKR